jgi:diketogulonate reductase-like aldo/keto reductase
MPQVALGTWPESLPAGYSNAQITDALLTWIDLGGRHIDTAFFYQNQEAVGDAVRIALESNRVASRSELFVTSKVNGPIGYQETLDQVNTVTLPALGEDHVDLLLMHWPCCGTFDQCEASSCLENRVQTWLALEELRAAGKATNIGVSNFHVTHLESLFQEVRDRTGRDPNVTANQIPWNLGQHDDALFAWCQQRGITIESYSPLGGPNVNIPVNQIPEVVSIAQAHNVSAFQVTFRWIVQQGIVLVTASVNPSHMAEDLDSLFAFSLTDSEMATLSGLQTQR